MHTPNQPTQRHRRAYIFQLSVYFELILIPINLMEFYPQTDLCF